MNKKLLKMTLRNTSGAVIYIFLVSQLMQNSSKIFGKTDNLLTPVVVLLLFCLSASIVGGLVLGKSLLLFLDNKKGEGVRSAIYSIGWLGIFTILGFIILIVIK